MWIAPQLLALLHYKAGLPFHAACIRVRAILLLRGLRGYDGDSRTCFET